MSEINENRIKCGKCNTEFDLNKNDGCPLCGFGNKKKLFGIISFENEITQPNAPINYLVIPNDMELTSGKPTINDETNSIGSWGMFNSLFPGKAVLRILSKMQSSTDEIVTLQELVKKSSDVFLTAKLSKLRGFPNEPKNPSSISRLVYHFIKTFTDMGFFAVDSQEKSDKNIWDEPWTKIKITVTKEGLKFAQLPNRIFDYNESSQVLTKEEKDWFIGYLKKIDELGYKEYSILHDVFQYIQQGHTGKELGTWFQENPVFISYVKQWSRQVTDPDAFNDQLKRLSPTFSSAKIALLREIGVINTKRGDYTIIGDF